MSKGSKTWSNKQHKFSVVLLFVFASALSVYLMPTQGKFKYEFQKGTPWQHEDLIASFDFAIRKTDNEIKKEYDDELRNVKPYFKYDNEIGKEQVNLFSRAYSKRYNQAASIASKHYPNIVVSDTVFEFGRKLAIGIL